MHEAIRKYKERMGCEVCTPKLALFDMDGVLYDSMPNHAKAWHESMKVYGVEMSEEEAFMYEGMRGVETIRMIVKQRCGRDVMEQEALEMYAKKAEFYSKAPRAELIPGVRELQRCMKAHGMRIGVVTGSGQHTLIERILDDFNGLVSPDVVVTALDVERGKPAPDPYLLGMKKGGCLPQETIVVENAPLGVMAGKAAGSFTVAVNTGPLQERMLYDAGADMVFGSMAELQRALESELFD